MFRWSLIHRKHGGLVPTTSVFPGMQLGPAGTFPATAPPWCSQDLHLALCLLCLPISFLPPRLTSEPGLLLLPPCGPRTLARISSLLLTWETSQITCTRMCAGALSLKSHSRRASCLPDACHQPRHEASCSSSRDSSTNRATMGWTLPQDLEVKDTCSPLHCGSPTCHFKGTVQIPSAYFCLDF